MKITAAIIVKDNFGPDLAILKTTLPCPTSKDKFASIKMDLPKDQGVKYVRTNFPNVEIKVIPA